MDAKNTGAELAKLLRLTPRRIDMLVKEGVLKREPNGKFNIPQALEDYFTFKFRSNDEGDYKKEHALLESIKRKKAELDLAVMQNELHRASDVEQALTTMVVTFRNKMLGIPSRMAPVLTGLKDPGKIEDILDDEIRIALNSLAEYDPGMFVEEK